MFLGHPPRLRALVERGALCSITAQRAQRALRPGAQWFALELLRDGLVHSVDSDAHDAVGRPPGLREGMLDAAETLPFVAARAGWYMTRVPAALLADEPLPQQYASRRPPRSRPPRSTVKCSAWRAEAALIARAPLGSRSSSMIAAASGPGSRGGTRTGLGRDRLARAADGGDDLRHAARHRLQRADRERLPARRQDVDVEPAR